MSKGSGSDTEVTIVYVLESVESVAEEDETSCLRGLSIVEDWAPSVCYLECLYTDEMTLVSPMDPPE